MYGDPDCGIPADQPGLSPQKHLTLTHLLARTG